MDSALARGVSPSASLFSTAFSALDDVARRGFRHLVVAYSGGKDSTAVAILVYRWIRERAPSVSVTLLHGDTLSEVEPVEVWARRFMEEYRAKLSQYVDAEVAIVAPEPTETFFWRVFVRGYPAPSFKWRWCVRPLKFAPAQRFIAKLGGDAVVVVGLRDEESAERARLMARRFGACQPGSCLGAFFSMADGVPKVAPIRNWTTEQVWAFLRAQRDFDVSDLVRLYATTRGRQGCWHCTLVRVHAGLYVEPRYAWVDALRLIYRAVSDVAELRWAKDTGYSRLGGLTALGRAVIYRAVPIVEERSGHRFYGLDAASVGGYTLREIFYELDVERADAVVRGVDNTERWVGMRVLRETRVPREVAERILSIVERRDVMGGAVARLAGAVLEEVA